ncbi:MAG: nicotinate-nucleotide--dimethylbenzimidazole phosphoribosyltransferase [Ruminococcus callidus]
MAGAFLGGAVYHVPVLIDGFISRGGQLCRAAGSFCRQYLFASHCSRACRKAGTGHWGWRAYLDYDMFWERAPAA